MTATPTPEIVNIADLQNALTPLADKLADLNTRIAALTLEAAEVKAQIRALAPAGTFGAGTHLVTVAANRRLDLDAVAKAYPATEHPGLYRLTPDPAKVRQHLAPAVVDAFMAEAGEPRITVKDARTVKDAK